MAAGDPRLPRRFWEKVSVDEAGCWLWTAYIDHGGYGRFRIDGKTVAAHRVAFFALAGDLPPGTELDHLCRVRNCVNPDHLEPVTHRVNVQRGRHGWKGRRTHCKHGHEFTPENTRLRADGSRACRACGRATYYRSKERAA